METDEFLMGVIVGSNMDSSSSSELKNDKISYEMIHEIIVRNFREKKEVFQTFEKKEEISDCFMKIDQEIKKLFD